MTTKKIRKKKRITMKDVKNDSLLSAMYSVETIHQMPSYVLIEFQKILDMELKDRKYLKNKNWMERMFSSMGR